MATVLSDKQRRDLIEQLEHSRRELNSYKHGTGSAGRKHWRGEIDTICAQLQTDALQRIAHAMELQI